MNTKDNFFYGLEGSNLFKIYVSDVALHGAKVGTNVYNEQTARAMTMHFGLIGYFIGKSMAKKAVQKRADNEAKYDAFEPGSPPFREGDKANFSLAGSDVQSAVLTPKPTGLKGAFSGGPMLELQLAGGKKRKFLLIENQNLPFIKNLIARPIPMATLSE